MSPTLRRLATPQKLILLALTVVLLFVPVLVNGNLALLAVITSATVFVMFAASWDILSGFTGQVNFGHAAFIGAGAYTVGLLSKYHKDVSGEVALILGMLIAAAIGLVIGVPCLRLTGPYLALATLTAASALFQLAFIFKAQTGGEEGISGVQSVDKTSILGPIGKSISSVFVPGFGDLRSFDRQYYVEYYVTLLLMLLMVGGLLALGYGKRGLVLRSIQQQESAAEAAGVPVTRYKIAAFVLSAACAGLAGGLLAMNRGSVGITELLVTLSLAVIIVSAIGGVGSIIGPAIGAYLVGIFQGYLLDRYFVFLREHGELKVGLFALILIVVLIVQPRGLVPPIMQKMRDRQNRALLEGSRG